ncbi:MAG: LytR C-terminal domain-containing protein [Pseudonocardiaceae bacterium]
MRTTGLALCVLATLAVLIGSVVAFTRAERTAATGQPPATPTHAPSSASANLFLVPYPPPVPAPPSRPAQAPAPPSLAPLEAAEGAPVGERGPSDKGSSRGAVRVYNNSTARGLAARAARDLTAAGWTVVEVGNYARGTILTTTAYYQEGTDQRAAAQSLGAQFRMRVEPRFPGIVNSGPGLIVIVTNDYASPQ